MILECLLEIVLDLYSTLYLIRNRIRRSQRNVSKKQKNFLRVDVKRNSKRLRNVLMRNANPLKRNHVILRMIWTKLQKLFMVLEKKKDVIKNALLKDLRMNLLLHVQQWLHIFLNRTSWIEHTL